MIEHRKDGFRRLRLNTRSRGWKTPEFAKDRGSIYLLLIRPDFAALRESAIADLHSRLDHVENTVLAETAYIGGEDIIRATIHAIWAYNGVCMVPRINVSRSQNTRSSLDTA